MLQLTNTSAVAVVEILDRLMTRKRHGNERSLELADDFHENIVTVASRIKNKMSSKEYQLKLLESLSKLFEVSTVCRDCCISCVISCLPEFLCLYSFN